MLDSLDEKLIQLLAKDAQQTSKVLATQLNVNPTTVRRRLKKLIRSGVVRIASLADPNKVGLPLITVIAFDVARHGLESAVQMLASQPEVKWVSTTTGRFDSWSWQHSALLTNLPISCKEGWLTWKG